MNLRGMETIHNFSAISQGLVSCATGRTRTGSLLRERGKNILTGLLPLQMYPFPLTKDTVSLWH